VPEKFLDLTTKSILTLSEQSYAAQKDELLREEKD
jgi:hypothetical protein